MEPTEIPAVSCCPCDSMAGSKIGAPWEIDPSPRRAMRRCDCRYDCGTFHQIQDQEPFCLFQAHECRKCTLFSEQCKTLPAEDALKMELGSNLKSQGPIRNGLASPPTAHGPVRKLTVEPGIVTKRPSSAAAESLPKIFVSALDASTLEEATNNFSFQEDPQAPFPAQHIGGVAVPAENGVHDGEGPRGPGEGSEASRESFPEMGQDPKASDQDSASSEWQRKLEAAEALLCLRASFQAPAGSVSLLEPCVAPAPAGDRELQPPSPSLQPMPASSVSLPIEHPGCISLLS
ncbi:doublesex- and mab-3-related transcription factor C1 [Talpa occidentalis]|uniref:doublesex- and mab-3-related transcription factor C1 n=1 Tax=Talpa occidentalis TaxID=50954 RepID=UPI0023F7AB7B|nr:doublesex- and mab-3-related transcription factor C1 [Talpa occidentalis]